MKKFLLAALAAALLVGAAGCGADDVKENEAKASTAEKQERGDTAVEKSTTDTDGDGTFDLYDAAANDPTVQTADQLEAVEDDSAPTEDEEYVEEDYYDEPETEQTERGLNEWGADEGMKVKVTSMETVDSIPPTAGSEWLYDGVSDKPGSKLIEVHVEVKNNGNVAIDPMCGSAYGFTLLDQNDRNFEPLDKLLDINNNVCDDGISPGFKSSYKIAYRIPNGSDVGGLVVWNSESEDDFDGAISQVLFLP